MSESREYYTTANETGSVNISEEVLAVIAGAVASEVEGVASLTPSPGKDAAHMVNKKALGRSVKIGISGETVTVEIAIIAEIGYAVAKIGQDVQKAVSDAIADSCGIVPKNVDVKIVGVKTH